MTKQERKNRMSTIIAWALVVIAASAVPVIFGHNVWTFGFQALMCIIALAKVTKKTPAPSKNK